ncbi:MAG: DUF1566 domain-containing protein [Methylococcales bacterium]|nr:DUF1566 domain-containing protein [Methylococcales bacterium]
MSKPTKKATLSCLLALLPLISHAQTCQTSSIPATTPDTQFTNNNNGTVTDNKTGLMWKRCSEGQTFNTGTHACDGSTATYTWQGVLQQAQSVNTAGFAGANDWRVPNIKELRSLVELQCVDPSINLMVFPATPSAVFWSSSSYADYSYNAWNVYFGNGSDDADGKYYYSQVRLVRIGQ